MLKTIGILAASVLLGGSTGAATLAPVTQAAAWINGPASSQSLRGKVVVLDVFTFDCINCKHVVPELRTLRDSVSPKDLAIVGIHSPETSYERDHSNVVTNLKTQGITWPVAVDNDFRLWNAYGIEYWPTQMIFDRHGRLRKTVIGEGQDDVVAATVHELVDER